MKEMKLHAYLITIIVKEDLEKINKDLNKNINVKGKIIPTKNIMVCAYDRAEALTLLMASWIGDHVIKINAIQTLRKNKQNARWFTRETYERELELIFPKGK